MFRHFVLCLLLLAGLAAFAAPAVAPTVVINGKTVSVPMIKANGKAYVDIVALMKLLGGSASFNAVTNKLIISTTGATTSTAASGDTAQMAGDNGELGKIYSLVKSNPLYFSLLSAEYTTTPLTIGDRYFTPKANEKLLVLHFTVQNPQKTERLVRYDSLHLTAVDQMNVNHEGIPCWGDAEKHDAVSMLLKPAQKLAIYTCIIVPAKGIIPKLMIMPMPNNDGPILRYDLREKVTGMTAPIADPADATGATALETVPGTAGVAYSYANFDVSVEQFGYTTETLDGTKPEKDGRFLIATLLVKNRAPRDSNLRYDMVTPEVKDTDGALLRYRGMLFASSDRRVGQLIKSGEEMRVRLYFIVPKGSNPAKLTLKEGQSRTYEFAIQ